jgi:hypothetical protein
MRLRIWKRDLVFRAAFQSARHLTCLGIFLIHSSTVHGQDPIQPAIINFVPITEEIPSLELEPKSSDSESNGSPASGKINEQIKALVQTSLTPSERSFQVGHLILGEVSNTEDSAEEAPPQIEEIPGVDFLCQIEQTTILNPTGLCTSLRLGAHRFRSINDRNPSATTMAELGAGAGFASIAIDERSIYSLKFCLDAVLSNEGDTEDFLDIDGAIVPSIRAQYINFNKDRMSGYACEIEYGEMAATTDESFGDAKNFSLSYRRFNNNENKNFDFSIGVELESRDSDIDGHGFVRLSVGL